MPRVPGLLGAGQVGRSGIRSSGCMGVGGALLQNEDLVEIVQMFKITLRTTISSFLCLYFSH